MTPPLPTRRELARRIDHALLAPGTTERDVELAAEGCAELGVRALVVAPCHVRAAARVLQGSGVTVCAVVGFPLGASTSPSKQFEALECEKLGAAELDVVINVGALKGGDRRYVETELADVLARTPECTHKAIVETGLLDASQVRTAVAVVNAVGPRFIKTCTGYGPRGVTVADVELLRADLRDGILVKASAGIRTLDAALALLAAGASVLGTSSTKLLLDELDARIAGGRA